MQVIRLNVNDSRDELRALRDWLADESLVRRYGHLRDASEPAPDGVMSALAALSLVVGSGLTITQLVTFIVTWRAGRPKPVAVRVEVGGRSVEVRTNDVRDVPALVKHLEASLADEPEAG